MRPSLSAPVALTAGLASLALAAPALAAPATVGVGQGGDVFTPANITVNAGEAVTWHWVKGTHNVHFTGAAPSRGDIDFQDSSGGDKSRTFSGANTYHYVCEAHDGMDGTITVVAPQPAGTGNTGNTGTDSTAPSTTGSSAQPVTGTTSTSGLGADAAAPAIRQVRFRANALRLRLSEAAKLEIRYVRSGTKGHTVGKRVVSGRAGANAVALRRWLRPGRYRVSILAIDAAGNTSRPSRLRLTVRR